MHLAMIAFLIALLIPTYLVAFDGNEVDLNATAGNPFLFKSDMEVFQAKSNLTVSSYGWTEYKQCDSRWANEQLGTCSSTTICSAGCAMSSVAMILATKGCSYTPSTLNSWLKSHSGKFSMIDHL